MTFRSIFKRNYLALPVLLIFSTSLAAQSIVEELPPEYEESVENWVSGPERLNSPFYKGRFLDDETALRIKQGQIVTVARNMIAEFEALDWGDHEFKRQKILNQLQRFLGALAYAMSTQGIEGALDKKSEQNLFLESMNNQDFGLHTLGIETIADANGLDVSGYFAETEDELLLYKFVDQGDKFQLLLTNEQVREWRLLENALNNLFTEQVKLISEANIRSLKNAVVRWENYLDNGYSQMPWESTINGWFIKIPEFPQLGPPDRQFLFFHPTLGIELQTDPIDETRVKEVLHIELFGHIWYRGLQLEKFSGLSVSASLREDLDPGIGLMFHIKRNWSVGVAWHDVDEDPFLFFSVDLFRFAKQRAAGYVEKYESLRTQLNSL